MSHPDPALVSRYAAGGPDLDDVTAWSVEVHLDNCPFCRAVLAGAVDARTRAALDAVADAVGRGIEAGPPPAPLPRGARGRLGTAWRVAPWFLTVLGVLATALATERAFPSAPSMVLLVSPLAPLLPVAAAWTRGTDPAWELVCSAPRAGLGMLLRRALVVILALVPFLAGVGWWSGSAPGLWLLPGLAFTAGSLALGGLVGVARAAAGLTAAWSLGVIVPSLVTRQTPAVLHPGAWSGWAAAAVALLVAALLRADDHRRLTSRS